VVGPTVGMTSSPRPRSPRVIRPTNRLSAVLTSGRALARPMMPRTRVARIIGTPKWLVQLQGLAQDHGSSVFNAGDENGWNTAHIAARNGHMDVLRFLATTHGCVGFTATTGRYGLTPAHLAARGGHLEVLQFLTEIQGNAVLTTADEDGWMPAHSAARGGHLDVLKFVFTKLGAEEVLTCRPSIEHIAAKYGQREVLHLLKDQAEQVEYEFDIGSARSSASTGSNSSTFYPSDLDFEDCEA